MRSQRKKTPRKRKAELLGPVKGTISTDPTPPIPSRLQKFLALADETLEREVLQRSVIDVQPVFQPPKPPRLKQPKPPVRAPLPPPPPLKLPKPPKPPKTPKPLSSMPKRKQS